VAPARMPPNAWQTTALWRCEKVALGKKIEDDPATPRYLISVRGVGYRFDG